MRFWFKYGVIGGKWLAIGAKVYDKLTAKICITIGRA